MDRQRKKLVRLVGGNVRRRAQSRVALHRPRRTRQPAMRARRIDLERRVARERALRMQHRRWAREIVGGMLVAMLLTAAAAIALRVFLSLGF